VGVLPAAATVTLGSGALRHCWACTAITDPRALQSADKSQRHAAAWYHPTQLVVQLKLPSGYSGNLRLYAIDWDSTQRREQVTVNDGSGTQSPPINITTAFNQGAWMTFPVTVNAGDTVTITIVRTAGANAVLSGIFLGPPGVPLT
jgi:hypothetical protein